MENIDLTNPIPFDTMLSVKLMKPNGKTIFYQYIIPRTRKDGSERLFGDLYFYFTKKEGFRFAIGYLMTEDKNLDLWIGQNQYFYFDKKKEPQLSFKKTNPLYIPKKSYKPHL